MNKRQLKKLQKRQMKEKVSVRDVVGDVLELIGDKVSEAGADKLGQKIHNIGDRIEKKHSGNSKHG